MSLAQRWLELIASDVEDFHRDARSLADGDPRRPGWVRNVENRLERLVFPVAFEDGEKVGPEKVGRILGQSYAYFGWVLDCMRREKSALRDRFRRTAAEFLEEDYCQALEEAVREQMDAGLAFQFMRFLHVLKRALALAVERPFIEAARFFDGFHSAVRLRAKDDSAWTDKLSTAATYYVLLRDWQHIQRLRSVPMLHQFLQHRLGKGAAGDLERTQTLAKRLGLKLARRGRPRKK